MVNRTGKDLDRPPAFWRRWLRRLLGGARSSRSLDLSWVTPSLAVGAAFPPGTEERLVELGIGAVVDLRAEGRDDAERLSQLGIRFLHLPTVDHAPLAVETFEQGVRWVLDQMSEGTPVLIHCAQGVGRSATLACAVLVASGYRPHEALHLVKLKRTQASPNARQLEALMAYVNKRRAEA
ncbi:MAG TPA: dual specificity protein phosphatase [Chloroflexota bacterium]